SAGSSPAAGIKNFKTSDFESVKSVLEVRRAGSRGGIRLPDFDLIDSTRRLSRQSDHPDNAMPIRKFLIAFLIVTPLSFCL
ncbi:MAG TPA: hypothetical protein PK529_12960, partial [Verrucomicrobiales bacterium]|nr:hypothetical protein [Verrucomicrobiales bacterium]